MIFLWTYTEQPPLRVKCPNRKFFVAGILPYSENTGIQEIQEKYRPEKTLYWNTFSRSDSFRKIQRVPIEFYLTA